MAKVENDLDIYYPVGNTNTRRQENEIKAIMKNVILQDEVDYNNTAIVDTKNQFLNHYLFWEKKY